MASITTSRPSAATSAAASSVTKVVPLSKAAAKELAPTRSAGQPVRARAARAFSGSKSATAITWKPAVMRAWAKNMDPNLPAPIKPTRTGRPASAR